MQIRLKIAAAAAGFALVTIPAFAAEMPADGSKNFSTPTDAPSYFTNESVPESARVDRPATFSSEDVAAAPDVGPAVSVGTDTGRHDRQASAHRSTRHSPGKSRGHGASTYYAKASTSKAARAEALHGTASHTNTGSRSASVARDAGRGGGTHAGASKPSTTKHARTNTGQHAAAMPSEALPLSLKA
jgi:hypothetical protein